MCVFTFLFAVMALMMVLKFLRWDTGYAIIALIIGGLMGSAGAIAISGIFGLSVLRLFGELDGYPNLMGWCTLIALWGPYLAEAIISTMPRDLLTSKFNNLRLPAFFRLPWQHLNFTALVVLSFASMYFLPVVFIDLTDECIKFEETEGGWERREGAIVFMSPTQHTVVQQKVIGRRLKVEGPANSNYVFIVGFRMDAESTLNHLHNGAKEPRIVHPDEVISLEKTLGQIISENSGGVTLEKLFLMLRTAADTHKVSPGRSAWAEVRIDRIEVRKIK